MIPTIYILPMTPMRAIRKFDPRTSEVTTVLGRGRGDAKIRLRNPHGVSYERGSLYVVDMGNNRILKMKQP